MGSNTDSPTTDLRNPGRTVHVGVILMKGMTEILDVAPIDYLHGLTSEFIGDLPDEYLQPHYKQQTQDFQFHWVNETGETAKLTGGINLQPTDTFETCPPLDISLIGAHKASYQPNEKELAFIRKTYESCHSFLTICGGMMAPLQAGVLNGHHATGPRGLLPQLKQMAPDVKWEDKRYVHDGKLWSSGTLLNGMDMMAAFGRETFGAKKGEKDTLADVSVDIAGWPVRGDEYAKNEGLMHMVDTA